MSFNRSKVYNNYIKRVKIYFRTKWAKYKILNIQRCHSHSSNCPHSWLTGLDAFRYVHYFGSPYRRLGSTGKTTRVNGSSRSDLDLMSWVKNPTKLGHIDQFKLNVGSSSFSCFSPNMLVSSGHGF